MRRSTKGLSLTAVIVVAGCLAAGCGSSAQSAISHLTSKAASITATSDATTTPTSTVTITPTPTVTITPTPTVTITPTPTVTSTATATTTVTATATPSTPSATASTPGATPSASPAASTSSASSLLWLWILLGALVLAGLIAVIVHSARRSSATAADWRSRIIDAYAKGSALHDAMSVAEAPGEIVSANAAARWADIQRRADDLTQTLYMLREAVPDEDDRARITDTLASLQAVRSAMAAERAPGGAIPQQAEVVRGRLYSFEMSLRALRAGTQGYA
jgi:hypothetical protein